MIWNFTVLDNKPIHLNLSSNIQSSFAGNEKNTGLKLCKNVKLIEEIEKNTVDYSNEKAIATNKEKGGKQKYKFRN